MVRKYSKVSMLYSIILIIVLLAYPILFILGFSGIFDVNVQKNQKLFEGIFVLFVGVLFLMSHFLKSKSFLFDSIIWVCKNGIYPKGKWMALFMGMFCIMLGIIRILNELFHIDNVKIFGIIHMSTIATLIVGFIIFIIIVLKLIRKNQVKQD